MIDPACGSGHFLLYAFDLLERIYEEAWADSENPASEATGRTLREDYGSIEELRRAVPKLIIKHNLYGIDIDSRAIQIAALALWLRAQKAWQRIGLKATERPQVVRSNIVTAEPMPGEDDMRRELVDRLRPRVLGQLVNFVFERMTIAGEEGSLLKVEEEIKDVIAEARKQWLESSEGEQQLLFAGMIPRRPEQKTLRFDLSGVDNELFWEEAESQILAALKTYAERADDGRAFRRRLFAEDAARGFAFIDLCRKRYDVVLMNPPFGKGAETTETSRRDNYPKNWKDIYASFIERALWVIERKGFIGCITSSQFLYTKQLLGLRLSILERKALHCFIELGHGVLDGATVETALSILHPSHKKDEHVTTLYMDLKNHEIDKKGEVLFHSSIDLNTFHPHILRTFEKISTIPFSFHSDPGILALWQCDERLEPSVARVATGNHTFEDQRFLRLNTEVPLLEVRSRWLPYEKGGEYQPFYAPTRLLVDWNSKGEALCEVNRQRHGSDAQVMQASRYWYRKGLCYSHVSSVAFGPRILPKGEIFSSESISIFIREHDKCLSLLALLCSTWTQDLIWVFGRYRKIENRAVSNLPISVKMIDREKNSLRELALNGISEVRRIETLDETSPVFCLPDAILGRNLRSSHIRLGSGVRLRNICDEIDNVLA